MVSHRAHPDPDKDAYEDSILWDDCARCAELANDLTQLDTTNLKALYQLDQGNPVRIWTSNEATAVRNIRIVLSTADRIFSERAVTLIDTMTTYGEDDQ